MRKVTGENLQGECVSSTGQHLLSEAISSWRGVIARPAANAHDLTANLEALYRSVYATDFTAIDVAEVRALTQPASEALFDLYLALRDRIPEWRAAGLMTGDAPRALRNAMRILRYTTDIVIEVGSGYARLPEGGASAKAFTGEPHWTLMHPALRAGTRAVPEAGDVLLVRGQLHNSAAIARIGDVDSQFSHVGIVHVGDDGRRWLVEALIEEGSVWSDLDQALDHGLGRAVLFRHRDRDLARRAAEGIAAFVDARTDLVRWLPYDFSMELDGTDSFFCSKLVRHAYQSASPEPLALPSFPTRLAMTNRDFFERIGVTATETIAPADFEMETAFDIVAEWRDPRVTSAIRMQDLLMSKLFDWMDLHGYRFRENVGMSMMALAGRMTSFMPGWAKDAIQWTGLPKIPSNMTARTIATIGMLHHTAEPMLQRLIALETDRIRTTGRPMHPREAQAELERVRELSGGRLGYLVAPTT